MSALLKALFVLTPSNGCYPNYSYPERSIQTLNEPAANHRILSNKCLSPCKRPPPFDDSVAHALYRLACVSAPRFLARPTRENTGKCESLVLHVLHVHVSHNSIARNPHCDRYTVSSSHSMAGLYPHVAGTPRLSLHAWPKPCTVSDPCCRDLGRGSSSMLSMQWLACNQTV